MISDGVWLGFIGSPPPSLVLLLHHVASGMLLGLTAEEGAVARQKGHASTKLMSSRWMLTWGQHLHHPSASPELQGLILVAVTAMPCTANPRASRGRINQPSILT